jgi:signal transduction histidine kinase
LIATSRDHTEDLGPLAHLADRLNSGLDPHDVLPAVATVVAQGLPARRVAIYLKRFDGEDLLLAAQHGLSTAEILATFPSSPARKTPEDLPAGEPANPVTFPLVHDSETVGQLIVVLDGNRRLTSEETRLLRAIAGGAGAAAQVMRQAHVLQLARERLVLAREEERRRLRRNLHDTIGPTLSALSLKAGAVRNLIQEDPGAAQEGMNELRQQIQSVITDIRRVVYDLRPPALDELGIIPAIREQAQQFSIGGLQVLVEAPDDMPALPAAVEVAAYRIVLEALANVGRHAHAHHCRIFIGVEDRVNIEVTDDGVGLPASHRAGVGISSMRERVAELGGGFAIDSPPEGGTRVQASLPIGPRSLGWVPEARGPGDIVHVTDMA